MDPSHTNLDIFASAYTFCAHHSAKNLSDRGYINTLAPNSLDHASAGNMIWSQIIENDHEQRCFWENAIAEIKSSINSGAITTAHLLASQGLPERQAQYETWATKAVKALIASIRAELLASARAEMATQLEKKAEIDELELAEYQARYEPRERFSPVSPIDPRDLAMVDWDGPEPSIGRPSPSLSFLGASSEDEEGGEAAAAASYLDLDSLAPVVEVASAERLTQVKARMVDCLW